MLYWTITIVKTLHHTKDHVFCIVHTLLVTYTSVYTDSAPGRVVFGIDATRSYPMEGCPRFVIVYGYAWIFPLQSQIALPSPDYVPGLSNPPSSLIMWHPGPEHLHTLSQLVDTFVPGLSTPKYLVHSEED
ncbi:hypothetical protein Tco_0000740 [Tanacetum coccineum]